MELSRDARLLFIGLWNFCDDAGIHPAKVKTLKAEVFPSEDLTSADVRRMIDECIHQGLVIEYQIEGESYWQVTGWHHQKIDKPSFKYPKPCGEVPAGAAKRKQENANKSMAASENSTNGSRAFDDSSTNGSRAFDEHSPPESSRVESKGEEGSKQSSVVESSSSLTPYPQNQPAATRKGLVCGLLRKAGMADAAPHYLDDQTWAVILGKRTNEEIVELAKAKMAARPNQRTGLKYIAPALLEDPPPMVINGPSTSQQRRTIHDDREAVSVALTGRKPTHERTIANAEPRDITGESHRVA